MGGGKKRKIIDGVDTAEFTREQLEEFAYKLEELLSREREERNYFQIERDKIRTYWEITRKDLEETRAALENRERQLEEVVEKNEEKVKFYKQKLKHILYEQQTTQTDNQADTLMALKQAQDQFNAQEKEILNDKKKLKGLLKEQELTSLDQIKALKLQSAELISRNRADFEARAEEMEKKYEKKYVELRQHLVSKYEMEISEVEERKNEHISDLIKHHEKSFNEMRNYYNDITLNNLALINSMKDEMDKLRKINERMSKQVVDLTAETKRLKIPLAKVEEEIREYKIKLQNYERDKMTLNNTKNVLNQKTKELEDLRWIHDALELRFETMQREMIELKRRFVDSILEVQQKTGIKNLLLQKRVETLSDVAEHREAVIAELQNAATVPPVRTNQKLEEILSKKNATISDLQYELARVCKMHDDLLDSFEDKLMQFGIPKSELGFVPLRIIPEGQGGLATAPAGLVTKNR